MNKNKVVIASLSALISTSVVAGSMGPVQQPSSWSPVLTLSGGPAWNNNAPTQTIKLQPTVANTYNGKSSNQVLADGELFLGMQRLFNNKYTGQLGFAVAATSNAHLNGDIWVDADPAFNNFTYAYKVQHTHVAVKGKVLGDYGLMVTPYLSGSVGVGFNRAHAFTATPKISTEIADPPFQAHTTTAFTYTVGAGIQRAINNHVQLGVGYEFADWGKSQLARATGQTLNNVLGLSNLYTNALQFSVSITA